MLTLKYRGTTTIPLEAECITPDNLADKPASAIAALAVQHGNAPAPLGEFFDVAGDATDRQLVIEGDCLRVKWIGAGMSTGTIQIQGNAGMHLGAEMKGGAIHLHGDAGDWVGAEMRGGRIHIQGNAGHLVGAGYRGSRLGMRGGVILVAGNVGNEIGSGMRRGLIAVAGDTGDFPGVSMIAGTVVILGRPGIRIGAGMKRGSLLLYQDEVALLPTFRRDCDYRPPFAALYLRQLRHWGFTMPDAYLNGCYRRYSGDLIALGKGEVLCWRGARP